MAGLSGEYIASIDLGSHTARLLISKRIKGPVLFRPVARERAYTRLADGQGRQGKEIITRRAMERAVQALKTFVSIAEKYGVEDIPTVATGIMRRAANREELLEHIARETGIAPRVATGEEEAVLTAKGVLHSLGTAGGPYRVFDLGGATTEFIAGQEKDFETVSQPLGAMTLTRGHLHSDPPTDGEVDALEGHVDGILKGIPGGGREDAQLVGTGGTVTTLGTMIHHIDPPDISPQVMNGLVLKRDAVETLFERMKRMPLQERIRLKGLDQGRADVMIAGTLVVLRIMETFRSPRLTVSLSDILEGILIQTLEA